MRWALIFGSCSIGGTAIGLIIFGGLVVSAAYFGVLHRLGCAIGLLLAVMGSIIWWCFSRVLDSMALGGQNPASGMAYHYGGFPWWDSWWFQWGGSAVLLVCVIVTGACALRE
jgi:hypothetical protein